MKWKVFINVERALAFSAIVFFLFSGCSRDPVQLEHKFSTHGFKYLSKGEVSEAIIEFRNWVKVNPKSADAHQALAEAFGLKGWLPDAIQEYHEAVQLNPLLLKSHIELARYGLETGQFSATAQEIKTILKISPKNPEGLTLDGRLKMSLGQFDKADILFNDALKGDPNFASAWVGKGNLYLATKKMKEALAAYRKAISIDPNSQEALIGLGNVAMRNRDMNGARNFFTKAFRINPMNVEAAIVLGNFDVQTNAVDQAITLLKSVAGNHSDARIPIKIAEYKILQGHYDQAVALLTPLENMKLKIPEVHIDLAKAYDGQRNYKRALEELNSLLSLNKDNPLLSLSLAQVYLDSGNIHEASRILKTLENVSNQPVSFWQEVGRADLSLKKGGEALKAAKTGLEQAPGDQRLKAIEMDAYALMGDWRHGLDTANDLLKTNPDDSSLLLRKIAFTNRIYGKTASLNLTETLLKAHPDNDALEIIHLRYLNGKNELHEAIREAKKFVKSHPDAVQVREVLGELVLASGDAKGAESLLASVHRTDPKNIPSIYVLERIFQTEGKTDKALALLTEGVKAVPDNPGLHQERGDILLSLGNNAEAANEFRSVLGIQPLNPMALFNLSRIDAMTGHPEEALSHLKTLNSSDLPKPFRSQVLLLQGEVYARLRQPSKTEHAFSEAIALEPRVAGLHVRFGDFWMNQGKSEEALKEYQKALELNPKDELTRIKIVAMEAFPSGTPPKARLIAKLIGLTGTFLQKQPKSLQVLLIRARALVVSGRSSDGEKVYEKVLSIDGNNIPALLGITFLEVQSHSIEPARKHLETILRKDPANEEANILLARVDEISGDLTGEKKALEEVYLKDPKKIDTALILLNVALATKDYDEAFTLSQGLLKTNPDLVAARVGLIQVYQSQGNEREALKNAQALVSEHPDSSPGWTLVGLIESRLGHWKKAEDADRKSIALDHNNPVAYNNLALLLARSPKRLEEARLMVRRALALDDIPAIEDSAGLVSYRMGRYEEAEDHFLKAQARHFSDPEFLYHMGRNEWKMRKFKESQKNLQEALRSDTLPSDARKKSQNILEKIRSKNL